MVQGLNFGSILQGFEDSYEDEEEFISSESPVVMAVQIEADSSEPIIEEVKIANDTQPQTYVMEPNIFDLEYPKKHYTVDSIPCCVAFSKENYVLGKAPYIIGFSVKDEYGVTRDYAVQNLDFSNQPIEYEDEEEENEDSPEDNDGEFEEDEDYDSEEEDSEDEDYDGEIEEDDEPEDYDGEEDEEDEEDGEDYEDEDEPDDSRTITQSVYTQPIVSAPKPVEVVQQPVVITQATQESTGLSEQEKAGIQEKLRKQLLAEDYENQERERMRQQMQTQQAVAHGNGQGTAGNTAKQGLSGVGQKTAGNGTQQVREDYLNMRPERLRQVVRSFMEAKGVARAPIPIEVLENKFGREVVEQLIKKSFLVVFRFDGKVVVTVSI